MRLFLKQSGVFAVALAALLCCGLRVSAQEGEDPEWSQFTRENTLRGTVVAGGSNSFDIRTDGGQAWRVLYGPNTKIIKDRQPAKATEIHAGDMVFAAGNLDSKKKQIGAAILIGINAAEIEKAKEGLGKTWSAGKVTAVAGAQITVQRMDGVTQTIAVDENTSFRERKESVTLAEVKPGRGVRAEGTVIGGRFTATVLHVFDLNGHEPWLDPGAEKR